jgi:hypothetical protein
MNQYLEEMRKLPTYTLLKIINEERFLRRPEEVCAALAVLNERNVPYVFMSDDVVRRRMADKKERQNKSVFFSRLGRISEIILLCLFLMWVVFVIKDSNVTNKKPTPERNWEYLNKNININLQHNFIAPNNKPLFNSPQPMEQKRMQESGSKGNYILFSPPENLLPSSKYNDLFRMKNPFPSSYQDGSRMNNQQSLKLSNPELPSIKKSRDFSKPLDLSIQKPSSPDLTPKKW